MSYPSSEIIHPSSDLDDDVLIKVDNVSKKFCRDFKKSLWYGLKDTAADILDPKHKDSKLRPSEFWANQNIAFEVKRGECLGLIGRNGAGKTTLLKMLNGLIKPDTGSIEMRGRISALIALGSGFNPILTGRENIYVNGSILGLHKKEVDTKLDEIIDFAEIEDAIDSPVRTYSSGMQVRLGFAVATTMNPDVLILDEVLAVGDASFRAKCYNRIGEMQKNAAVIFVSHQMNQVSQVCSSALVLNNGNQEWFGDIATGVSKYNELTSNADFDKNRTTVIAPPLLNAKLEFSARRISHGDNLSATLDLDLETAVMNGRVRIAFYNAEGLVVAEWNSKKLDLELNFPAGRSTLKIMLESIHLKPGIYDLALIVNNSSGSYIIYWSLNNHSVVINGKGVGACEYQLTGEQVSVTKRV